MRLRKLGTALVVMAALGAVLASSAFATATTTAEEWRTGATGGTILSGSETVSSSAVGTTTFATEVAGTKYVLEATGVECVGCSIDNSGSPASAVGSGKLKFTGVTVKEPAGCSTTSSIETAALSVTADWMSGTTAYVKFAPTKGESSEFFTVSISGSGCLGTNLVVRGSLFVEAAHTTGTYVVEQEVHSSAAINTAAGGDLKVGTLDVTSLTGSAKFKMAGTDAGEPFGVQ